MKQKGFSLIEVMIAGAVMIGLALGIQQLVSANAKSAGDLEKRMRFRDLVEDIRFVFTNSALCRESFNPDRYQDGAEVELALKRGTTLKKGEVLHEYGLKIDSLTLQDVRTFSQPRKTLFGPNGEYHGQYSEEATAADLQIVVRLIDAKQPLKAVTAVRVMNIRRTGAISEDGCYGNHDLPGRALAKDGGNRGEGAQIFSSRSGQLPMSRTSGGTGNRSERDCIVDSQSPLATLGRTKVIDSETITYRYPSGKLTRFQCQAGRLLEGP